MGIRTIVSYTTPFDALRKFMAGELGGLRRTHYVGQKNIRPRYIVRTDASTTGMGGLLICCITNKPVHWFTSQIQAEDLERFGQGPEWMAEYELLAVLLAIVTWGTLLKGWTTQFWLQMDSAPALSAALKLSSSTATVNLVAAEIALRLEALSIPQIEGEHYRGTLNIEADALSRLSEGKEVPASCVGIEASVVPPRSAVYQLSW